MIDIKGIENWISNYIKEANAKGIVLGMSGGKDSLIVAKLCCNAIGNGNVLGIIMPNGEMTDYKDAEETCKLLGIKYVVINIQKEYNEIISKTEKILADLNASLSEVTTINTAPRIRMTTLYAIAGSLNYLVANTSNLSEISVGYTTKWGDNVGDFAPIADFTKSEVCEIGLMLGLPERLVNKVPNDGLSGKSDEDKLGVSYSSIDKLIRNNFKDENITRILFLNKISKHKRNGIAKYESNITNFLEGAKNGN